MKFAIERTISYIDSKRIKIISKEEDYFDDGHYREVKYMLVALIKTTEDFNLNETFNIVSSTDSIQYRPKGVFKNNKGYFYKGTDKKIKYLTQEETDQLLVYCASALKYINERRKIKS